MKAVIPAPDLLTRLEQAGLVSSHGSVYQTADRTHYYSFPRPKTLDTDNPAMLTLARVALERLLMVRRCPHSMEYDGHEYVAKVRSGGMEKYGSGDDPARALYAACLQAGLLKIE